MDRNTFASEDAYKSALAKNLLSSNPDQDKGALAKQLRGEQSTPTLPPNKSEFAKQLLGDTPTPAQSQYIADNMKGRMYNPHMDSLSKPENMERSTTAMSNALSTGGGIISPVLKAIDVPRSAIVSGIKAVQGTLPDDGFRQSVKEHPSYAEVLPDMPVNMHSYNNVRIGDVLKPESQDPESGKVVNIRKGVGFALDNVGDPAMWLSIGALTKFGKLGLKVSRLLSEYGIDAVSGVLRGSPEVINTLKNMGVSEKILGSMQKAVKPFAKDIAKITSQPGGDTLITELLKGNPNAVMQLQAAKVPDKTLKALQKLGTPLQPTLTEQAKAGQWAAAKFGSLTTPRAVNVPVAKAVDTTYQTLPKIPGINRFINWTGDNAYDAGLKEVDRANRAAKNEIYETGLITRRDIDKLPPDAFGGKTSTGWFESEGGVQMDNLLNGNFDKKQVAAPIKAKRAAVDKMTGPQMNKAATVHFGELMKKDLPPIAGMKPYFAPGPGEDAASYILHNIAGSGGQTPRKIRTKNMYLLEDSLKTPDFIFSQKNGRKYFGSVYDVDKQGVLHAVIVDLESDGRIREITQFSFGDKNVNEIGKEIQKKFGSARLDYISGAIKKGGRLHSPIPPPSLLSGPSASFAGTASYSILDPPGEAVKVRIAQRTKALQAKQLAQMNELGISMNNINELGSYSYAPHIMPDETLAEWANRKFRSEGKQMPSTKTPHTLHREIRWITDPNTGEETIGSVSKFAKENNIVPEKLTTRSATVDEINTALGKTLFNTDLAETTTYAALRNQNAIYGAEQINFFNQRAASDIEKIGGPENIPKGWVTPQLQVPKRYMSKDGKTFPIRDELSRLQGTLMSPEKARILEGRWKSVMYPDQTTKELDKLYSGYMSAWKRHTLFPFMEYHTRNAVGDIWNGWMHGWQPHQIVIDIPEAAMNQLGRGGGVKTSLYGKLSAEEVLKTARDYGVVGTGQWGEISNILAPISSKKGKGLLNKIKREAWDLETATKVGSFLEDNRRLALFSRELKNGATIKEAANVVNKVLYDYNDLTAFEQSVRKYAVPFYSWYRKNIPTQFENLIRHPGKVAMLPKAKAAIESSYGSNIEEEMRPEWMRREYSISTGKDAEGNENFAMLGSYIPTVDLFKYSGSANDMLANAMSNLNPALKVPLELTKNKDFFRNRPIDRLRDAEAAPWQRGGALWGNERTNYLGMDMPTTTQRMTELLPFTRALATLDRLNPSGVFDSPEEERGEKPRPYHNELTTKQKFLKAMTGLKNYPVDPDWQAYSIAKDIKGDYELAPGFNAANLLAAARRADREGDKRSGLFYEALAELLEQRAAGKEAMLDRYEKRNERW